MLVMQGFWKSLTNLGDLTCVNAQSVPPYDVAVRIFYYIRDRKTAFSP